MSERLKKRIERLEGSKQGKRPYGWTFDRIYDRMTEAEDEAFGDEFERIAIIQTFGDEGLSDAEFHDRYVKEAHESCHVPETWKRRILAG